MKYYAIIVAGGSGNRMQSTVAKQFLLLDGKPVLMHTLTAFDQCKYRPEILLVLNIHQHSYWEELCLKYNFDIPHKVVSGGEQRFHSVKNGLKIIKGNGIVAVHDAARPLVSAALINRSYDVAEEKGNCVAGITPTDSVRKILEEGNESLNRNELALIQTPQTFQVSTLRKAYQVPFRNDFTDDASVVEFAGFKINLIDGERENIKITYPEDLEIATIFIKKRELS
ncbi:2-C-methyl-D-erythritol 4-phosphate cytidylyltransferase [Pedobacter heparinus]|uniref:2-C-methyl-D-erythritol 4-phosphate cytidylyltransferase n=1 Tax=Pedobacter heparinus (strain ATCC 13125 / DSM 2366 / CIP 104194 / JCM 7457 / NBRC 12017 / NCIMB 9290 / NRRL B-14731 / HIM 762-3) TaxID=485917 RepID=C6Y065_PEDHD|nr:2-C-methyl-D-erythritol 4-phosphate cytidylyltransferase [Pedobacter heparinus]ACU04777.1 2-C-methyl-D-erythritol 4-phosphate cytidylyltransferase [Pedobacter heparinus DSM 2366]